MGKATRSFARLLHVFCTSLHVFARVETERTWIEPGQKRIETGRTFIETARKRVETGRKRIETA